MNIDLDQVKATYREEALEHLEELEKSMLELEKDNENLDIVGAAFRALHTIKGSGAMFGFDRIAEFTHDIENIYDKVRNGEFMVTQELITLTLEAHDQIKYLLDTPEDQINYEKCFALKNAFSTLLGQAGNEEKSPSVISVKESESSTSQSAEKIFRIRFKPHADLFMKGTNPIFLLEELSLLGDASIVPDTSQIPGLEEIDAEQCYTGWDIILTTHKEENDIRDVFIFVEGDCELKIDFLSEEKEIQPESDYKKLGEILIERGDIKRKELDKALESQPKIGQIIEESGVVSREKIQSALAEQNVINSIKEKKKSTGVISSLKVASNKLDMQINLVGELVTIQDRLKQYAGNRQDPELTSLSEEIERLTAELRDNAMSTRMLPIGTLFNKFQRLVRDLSRELGKTIKMVTDGNETELDKTVIDQLNDPLVHIIRNSIDHGIESPDTRKQVGKEETGMIQLSAVHSGANVLIKITDDGKGLDLSRIYEKAVEKEIVSEEKTLTEKEITSLIFAPGFSTAQEVSNVSGRGVGMDVVKKKIESLRGTVDIESVKGQGTTLTIKLPLTLAIIDGLLVKIGKENFVLPLLSIEECIELTQQDLENSHGRNVVYNRSEIVPYINLRKTFAIAGDRPEIEQVIITDIDNQRVGFVVDSVVGKHQTVIKSLGKLYKDVKGISGATILGDGSIAMILDINQLMSSAEIAEHT